MVVSFTRGAWFVLRRVGALQLVGTLGEGASVDAARGCRAVGRFSRVGVRLFKGDELERLLDQQAQARQVVDEEVLAVLPGILLAVEVALADPGAKIGRA